MCIATESWWTLAHCLDIILGTIGLSLLIYIIGSIYSRGKVLTSCLATKGVFTADQFYHLPVGQITINATVKIAVRTTADKAFAGAFIYEVDLQNTVQIVPDEQLIALKYHGSAFANDELRLAINPSGLLDALAVTSEDRITSVIDLITSAPQKILAPAKSLSLISLDVSDTTYTIQNLPPVSRSFVIYPHELLLKEVTRDWMVSIEGTSAGAQTVDASLRFDFGNVRTTLALNGTNAKDKKGLLTRPLCTLKTKVALVKPGPDGSKTKERQFEVHNDLYSEFIVPDSSKLITVPVRRSAFIKKVQSPKFVSGLLAENYINKPSEIEAFFSIPISIGKAIFSMPAQLLSFKISHVQQEASLAAETKKQLDALAALNTPGQPPPKQPPPADPKNPKS